MSVKENQAVFLSYASQDAEAARRLCDALRAAGVEVWFDQSELRGGDSWDQKIRKQIKECALFVPVISAATQARREGYFRLEWKLADDRTHLMAKGTPFLLPVCVDDTKDWDAIVPDSFMAVQWTRLPGGETPPAFVARVKALLAGEEVPRAARPAPAEIRAAPIRRSTPAWLLPAGVALAGAFALALWQPWRPAAPALAAAPAPVVKAPLAPAGSEGVKLARRARALYDKVGFTRDDMLLADDFAKRATELESTSAFCWGVRAHVQAAFLFRGFAVGDEFVQRSRDAQSFANRALALQADEPEALLALGRVATYQRAYGQAEEVFGRALAAHPADNRIRRALGTMLRYQPKRAPEALTVLQEAVSRDPRDALAHYDLSMAYRDARDFAASWQAIEATIALQPFGSAFTQKASLALAWKGDVPAMRAALEQVSPAERTEDRSVYYLMWCGLLERQPERVLAAAALNARDYLEDSAYAGPKAWYPALALQAAGQENSARLQWQAAERTLRERLRTDAQNSVYRVQLATTFAWMGRTEEAARELAPVEAAWREQLNGFRMRSLARHYAGTGDAVQATAYLRRAIHSHPFSSIPVLRLDPWWDKLRGKPEFAALLAAPPPAPKPIAPAPYLGKAPAAPSPAGREAEQLITQIYALLGRVTYTRENLAVAESQAQRATELAPESARAWAARARVHASYVQRTWDGSNPRLQATQAAAARALALDPDNADGLIAQSILTSRSGGAGQAEALLRRAVELRPADPLIRRLLATTLWAQNRNAESVEMSRETVRLFPDDALAHYDLGNAYTNRATRNPDLALTSFDAALAIEPFGSAYLAKVLLLAGAKGDLAAARRTLDQLPTADRSEDRAVSIALWLGLLERAPVRVEAAAALSIRPYFDDTYFRGPKAWMLALAHRQAARETSARLQWEAAESTLLALLQTTPDDLQHKLRLAITLAWLGRTSEQAADAATLESVAKESNSPFVWQLAAQYFAGLGDAARAVPYLRRVLNFRDTLSDRTLPLDPWWDKLHGTPEFEALLAEAKARIAQEKP